MPEIKVENAASLRVGAGRMVVAGRLELGLFRLEEGFFCMNNICPHAGGPLCDGYIRNGNVMCPYHNWEFNIQSGELLHSPDIRLATYPCRIEGEDVIIETP